VRSPTDGVNLWPVYRKPFDLIFERAKSEDWSALEDDFRTFLLMPDGSESIFQQFTAWILLPSEVNEWYRDLSTVIERVHAGIPAPYLLGRAFFISSIRADTRRTVSWMAGWIFRFALSRTSRLISGISAQNFLYKGLEKKDASSSSSAVL